MGADCLPADCLCICDLDAMGKAAGIGRRPRHGGVGRAAVFLLALAGYAARWLVEGIMLGTVGLEGEGGPIGDLSDLLSRVPEWFSSG